MLGTAAGNTVPPRETRRREQRNDRLITRKLWLPKLLYSALPWFYVGSGIAAFLATMYISEWFWILPHYLLFSVACVHLGLFVYRRRRRAMADDV